jgi:hypothetical protein
MAEHVRIDTFLNPGAAGGLDASVVGRLVIHRVVAAVPAMMPFMQKPHCAGCSSMNAFFSG